MVPKYPGTWWKREVARGASCLRAQAQFDCAQRSSRCSRSPPPPHDEPPPTMRPQLLLFVAVCATLLLVFESSFILDPEVHQRAAAADAGGDKRAAALRVLFVVLFCSPLLLGVLLVLLAAHPSSTSLRRAMSFFARHNALTASPMRALPMVHLMPRCGLIMGIPHCAAMLSTEAELEEAASRAVPLPPWQVRGPPLAAATRPACHTSSHPLLLRRSRSTRSR